MRTCPQTAGLVFLSLLTALVVGWTAVVAPSRADFGPGTAPPANVVVPETDCGPPAPPALPAPGSPDPPVPVVAINVRVPAQAAAGQEIKYLLCVENRSRAAAHHVLVRNPLPANARFVRADPEPVARKPELLWKLGTLNGGACCEILMVLAPTGTGDIQNCARVQFEHGQCVCTKVAQPGLSLRKIGPAQGILYDALNYGLIVSNTGAGELTGVVVTDTLPAGLEHASGKKQLTWDIGPLGPGQSRQVDYQLLATETGKHCNRAAAVADGGIREETESCVIIGESRLKLVKTGPPRRYANTTIAYQLTVANSGTAPLTNVAITDPLPPDTTFVRADNGGRLAGNQVVWSLGTLAPGASQTLELTLRGTVAGRICNRATATADGGLTAQGEACTDLEGIAGLLMEVVDTEDPVEVGAETSYIIIVRNQGTVPTEDVRIEALVPPEEAVTRVVAPADHRLDGQRMLFQPITLQPNKDIRYVIYVNALRPGDVRFKVDMFAKPLTAGPVHEEESTTLYLDFPSRSAEPPVIPQGRPKRAQ